MNLEKEHHSKEEEMFRAMPPDTVDPISVAYQDIRGVPFYMNFEYKLNWVTLMTIIDLLLNFIGTLIFIQVPIFYIKNKQKIKNIGLRLDVFQSFLLMQIWSIWMLIGEFSMFKIPFTGILTNYCANNNPQVILRFIVFFFHWAHYSAQLFTLLFCVLRVAILYSNSNKEKEKLFYYLIPPFIIFPFLASLPHLLSEGLCLQMEQPYPFGAILIISKFFEDNLVKLGIFYSNRMICYRHCVHLRMPPDTFPKFIENGTSRLFGNKQ
ncbi:hypothetical protein CRE_06069 [Caenorhabditis remanei]|uniref:Serpentine receptor class gamma n=1 Tax=Caenorhabditis remanei TaxID=31234 RepID=E3NB00_CAERE|nr:hypothetical protein CRE_06069 [Caenorhabditis remanei]